MKGHQVKKWTGLVLLPLGLLMVLLFSCEADNYEKGEGEYSLMRADFVQAHVGSDKRVDYIVTDDGDSLTTEPRFTTKAIGTADTIYRAILYYNKVKNEAGKTVAEAKGMSLVPTLLLALPEMLDPMKQDPVKFESLWTGSNGRYLNGSIVLMTGKDGEEDRYQAIAMVQDSVEQHDDGTRTLCCRLYHDQCDVPQYYSTQRYFSIPLTHVQADSMRIEIQTYSGKVVKTLAIRFKIKK
ncbi:MAG: NigD-like N-terminal domain-containing protein [Prevotella sp.]|nr:NigD-like N-terminal domain-containing protein [Prevotella sp.]